MKNRTFLFLILRFMIGALFVYSGYTHLVGSQYNFISAILSYRIVDARTAVWMAATLPWAEFIAGVFFILGIWFRAALFTLWSFSAVFMAAILSTFIRHIPLKDCGCFGEGVHIPVQATLALDIILFLAFLWMYRKRREAGHLGLDRFLD